jgi:hypothetical protein
MAFMTAAARNLGRHQPSRTHFVVPEIAKLLLFGPYDIGNHVHASRFDRPAIESATFAGRFTVAGAAHVRLLVSLTDSDGSVYHPGNRILGPGPYRLHVEAWSPVPLTHLRLVEPGGVRESFTIDSQRYFSRDVTLVELPLLYWFYVLVRGESSRSTAISNPMFVGIR